MTSALDTSVLVDVLWGDPSFGETSARTLSEAARAGALVVSPIVVAELRHAYRTDREVVELLSDLGIHAVALGLEDGLLAGAVHRQYRAAGGTRRRVLADFLIAAHARNNADRLIARDRGFFREHFEDLNVWYPIT